MTEATAIEMWRERVRRFVRDCEESAAGLEPQRLREAADIVSSGPMPHSVFTRAGLEIATLDGLIEAGAFESAALAVIGDRAALMMSRSADGRCLATIADHGVEATAEGASLALALLAAFAGSLLAATNASGAAHGERTAHPPTRIH